MKKIRIAGAAAVLSLSLAAFSVMTAAEGQTWDPESDPLVSLSYLNEVVLPENDRKLGELTKKLDELTKTVDALSKTVEQKSAAVEALDRENAALKKQADELSSSVAALSREKNELHGELRTLAAAFASSGSGWEVVFLDKGALLAADSPLELILRSGTAEAVSDSINGLNDVTDGYELMNGDALPLFHSVLIPRGGDGRGVCITSEGGAYVMLRGDYRIVNR